MRLYILALLPGNIEEERSKIHADFYYVAFCNSRIEIISKEVIYVDEYYKIFYTCTIFDYFVLPGKNYM